jgi:uncharacterized membrane protein YqiK
MSISQIIMIAILVVAIIFLLGILIQIIYLIITDSRDLTLIDCKRKNYWYKYLKIKK